MRAGMTDSMWRKPVGTGTVDFEGLRALGEVLRDKWTLPLLGALITRPHRFSELAQVASGTSHETVARTLRHLIAAGLVAGGETNANNTVVRPYELTDDGREVLELARICTKWLGEHPEIDARVQRLVRREPGGLPETPESFNWAGIWALGQAFADTWVQPLLVALIDGPQRFVDLEQATGAGYETIQRTVEHLQQGGFIAPEPSEDGASRTLRKTVFALTADGWRVLDLGRICSEWLAAHPRIDRNLRTAVRQRPDAPSWL